MADLESSQIDLDQIDRRNVAWYVDRAVQSLVFLGGMSAIVFSKRSDPGCASPCADGSTIGHSKATVPTGTTFTNVDTGP
jgi:hypothetical protein